jgi:hypothetical protein
MSAIHPLVGAWRVAVTIPGVGPGLINLAIISVDGTLLVAFPSPSPAAPNAGHRLEYWTPAVGSWAPRGDRDAEMTFVALGVDENGSPVGSHSITATVTADADGSGWHGPFQIEIIDAGGTTRGSVSGTVTATRISA